MYRATNVYFICGFAAIGGGLFGFDISSMSSVIGMAAYKRYFGNPVSYTQGVITAAMPAGSFVGALAASVIADKLSRKAALGISCGLWIIGSAVQAGSVCVIMLCVGRVCAGFGVGIASSVVPVYQAEIAPKEIRGRVVALQQWAITWGILIQAFVQYGSARAFGSSPDSIDQPTAAFRIPWAVQIIPALTLLTGLLFFPHSPRWLAARDRWTDALAVLAQLHGCGDEASPKVLAQYREIEDSLRFDREQRAQGGMWVLFRGNMMKRVALGMSVQAWSQLCGMNIMMYYIVYVMEAAEIASPLLAASVQYIINMVLTLPAILYIDRWGRRPSFLVGSCLMMTWLFIIGAIQQYCGEPNIAKTRTEVNRESSWVIVDNKAASRGVVACSYLFVATFATTWGPTSWIYPAEIYPGKIRAMAVSLSTATNWFWNTTLAFAVPPLLWHIHYKTWYLFGVFNVAALIHMFVAAHETKGFTLEEMDEVFESDVAAWRGKRIDSRLDVLEKQIGEGTVVVHVPGSPEEL